MDATSSLPLKRKNIAIAVDSVIIRKGVPFVYLGRIQRGKILFKGPLLPLGTAPSSGSSGNG